MAEPRHPQRIICPTPVLIRRPRPCVLPQPRLTVP